MNIRFIKTPEKRKIVEQLNERFGISQFHYLLIESGKEKIRAFSGSLSKEEISKIGSIANIESIGLYFLKREIDLRISLDASTILSDQITKNVIEISDEQVKEWLRGKDLDIKASPGTYIIKNKQDFLGCARSNGTTLFNYVPKDRRLKK